MEGDTGKPWVKAMDVLMDTALFKKVLEKILNFKYKSILTTEVYLIAIIETVDEVADKHEPYSEEAKAIAKMFAEYKIDTVAVCEKLKSFASKGDKQLDNDEYLWKKMSNAREEAEKSGSGFVFELTKNLLLDPKDTVRDILNEARTQKGSTFEKKVGKNVPDFLKSFDSTAGKKIFEKASGKEPKPDKNSTNESLNNITETQTDVKAKLLEITKKTKQIRTELKQNIFGQENAVNIFAAGYFQACLQALTDKYRNRPRATFLFAGPPGVGKTLLAESAAIHLGLPFRRFDMSEYSDPQAVIELCGSDNVYKDAKSGNLTSFVAKNPECVLLFDEMEKAHINVIHLFLQILDAGRLRDSNTDKEVSFKDTIIILTTNAGRGLYEESESGNFSAVSRKVIVKALQKDINPATNAPYFPAALCSRFASGNIVMFNRITAFDLRTIAKNAIQQQAKNFENSIGIGIGIDENVYTALLFSEGAAVDARTIRSRAQTFINDELYELLRLITTEKSHTDIETIKKIKICVDISSASVEIKKFFASAGNSTALVFAEEDIVYTCTQATKGLNINIISTQSTENAKKILEEQKVDYILIDATYGATPSSLVNLNIEDVESDAREFLKFIREKQNPTPIYLLESEKMQLNEEERVSFLRQGIMGTVPVSSGLDKLSNKLITISSALHHKSSMERLAKENKLITFETAQSVSDDGKTALIRLFDFELNVAVDAEDAKNVLSNVSKPNIHFEDVIGAKDAKGELKYFVDYLKNPQKYAGTGVKAPRGVLLYGPPGTGKTMLAKVMACESDATFIVAEGNQFLKRYVGEGPENIHKLFSTARKYAPSVLFIDEIDAIAKERKGDEISGGSEATLTALLTEMDGFTSDPTKPVFVLAATNFNVEPGTPKSLDPALMRRFDRKIYIDLPDMDERKLFIDKKISKNKALCLTTSQKDNIAIRSTGMSLSELDSVFELALRSAIRQGATEVDDCVLDEAFETYLGGEEKKWNEQLLERVARHEAGHALVCYDSGEKPSYITIVARGNHGGYMQHESKENKALYTKKELLARIRTSLGGRASELVYYGDEDGISTGASSDLENATRIAEALVCYYGMDNDFGLAVIDMNSAANSDYCAKVHDIVNDILSKQLQEAVAIISKNKNKIDAMVNALMVKNHLNGNEIEQIFAN